MKGTRQGMDPRERDLIEMGKKRLTKLKHGFSRGTGGITTRHEGIRRLRSCLGTDKASSMGRHLLQ